MLSGSQRISPADPGMVLPHGPSIAAAMDQNAEILLIGGGSRIAQLLAQRLGTRAACVSRRPTSRPGELIVEDYDAIPPSWFVGRRCVVQCVGTSVGDQETMERVNTRLPIAIAQAARSAGVADMVHVSSFSVYGRVRAIDSTTATTPVDVYGRSKLEADRALLALANDRFRVSVLRLPLVYGGRVSGKLEQLIRLWSRIRLLPVPAADVTRAMISIDLSADVIARLIDKPDCGLPDGPGRVILAADPRPFTYAEAARAVGGLYRLPLPMALTRGVERMAPGIGNRLFADSILADADNVAVTLGFSSRLYRDIAAAASS